MPENVTPDPNKGGRTFVPTRSYDLKVTIDNLDYTQDLILVRFASSLATAYQSVDIVLEIDPNDVILQQLYGASHIKLAITLLREDEYPGPRTDLDLMFTSGVFQLNEKDKVSSKEGSQKDRGFYSIRTVLREPYKIMNTFINDVFLGQNLNSIISSVARDAGANTVEYDIDGQNTQPIEQVCIPPTTLYKVLKEYNSAAENPFDGFLDQRFGLFDGVPGVFCQYDKTLYIKNLSAKMQKNQTFTIYQIATDMSQEEWDEVLSEVSKDDTFYTFQMVQTDYAGNAKVAKVGSKINHIVKPKDTLSHTISQDLKTVSGNYGVIYKNKNLDIDSAAERKRYFIQDTGNEKQETIFNSRIARRMADMATLTISIEKNLPVFNLVNVGECVKFKPKTTEYADLEGKYILWSTDVWFRRENNWQTTAEIKLMRTNKRAGDAVKPQLDISVLPENRSHYRTRERVGDELNLTREEVDRLTAGPSVEQVTQTRRNYRHPDSYSSAEKQEIRQNMDRIRELNEQNNRCAFREVGRPIPEGCSTREIAARNSEIERLRRRNEVLATVR